MRGYVQSYEYISSNLALLLLFCLTACARERSLLITKLGRSGKDTKEPTAILKPTFSKLSSSVYESSLAINEDGELYAWEDNSSGYLGDGTRSYEATPVTVKIPNLK